MSEFRTQFKNWGRVFRPHDPKEKSKTVQSAAQENDLNLIVDRLKKGLDPGVPIRESRYGLSVSPEMKEDSIMRVKDARSHPRLFLLRSEAIPSRSPSTSNLS